MEYKAVAHLNRVVEQPNKRECLYPLAIRDISLSKTDICLYSSH